MDCTYLNVADREAEDWGGARSDEHPRVLSGSQLRTPPWPATLLGLLQQEVEVGKKDLEREDIVETKGMMIKGE